MKETWMKLFLEFNFIQDLGKIWEISKSDKSACVIMRSGLEGNMAVLSWLIIFFGFTNLLHSWLSFNNIFPFHLHQKWYQYKAGGGKDQQVWAEQFLLSYKLYQMKSRAVKVLFYNNSIRQILEWTRWKLFVWSEHQTGEQHSSIYLQYWCRHVHFFAVFADWTSKQWSHLRLTFSVVSVIHASSFGVFNACLTACINTCISFELFTCVNSFTDIN